MHETSTRTFLQRYAIIILMVACFLVPFGMRGARMAMRAMHTDVTEWLPTEVQQAADLAWFREHFPNDSSIVAAWDGCRGTANDEHFRAFVDKFFREIPPSRHGAPGTVRSAEPHGSGPYVRELVGPSAGETEEFPGNKYGLHLDNSEFVNWGGQEEKWLRGHGGKWYYILPSGALYEWRGVDSWIGRLGRSVRKQITGANNLAGRFVHSWEGADGPWYYADTRRLEADLFQTMITGPSVLHRLTGEGGALAGDPEAAAERFQGKLLGNDGVQTCIVMTLTEHGKQNLHEVVGSGLFGRPPGRLLRMATESGLTIPTKFSFLPAPFARWFGDQPIGSGPIIHLGGTPVENIAYDEAYQLTLLQLVGFALALGLLVLWITSRSISVTVVLLLVGAAGGTSALGALGWSGRDINGASMSLLWLICVMAIAGGIHIVNYYRGTVSADGHFGDPSKALKLGWKPSMLAAFATALGFGILAKADIVPLHQFGIFSAIGVILTGLLTLLVVPAALQLWPPAHSIGRMIPTNPSAVSHDGYIQSAWQAIARLVIQRHALVSVACLAVLIAGAVGIGRLQTTVPVQRAFPMASHVATDAKWLETHLGPQLSMELVARIDASLIRQAEPSDDELLPQDRAIFDNSNRGELSVEAPILGQQMREASRVPNRPATESADERFRLSYLERMEVTERIGAAVDKAFAGTNQIMVGRPIMSASFAPIRPQADDSETRSTTPAAHARQFASYHQEIVNAGYFQYDHEDRAELWRISLGLANTTDIDYSQAVDAIKQVVEPILSAYKYRQFVLHAIDRKRTGNGFHGARVLVLGAQPPDLPRDGQIRHHNDAQSSQQWVLFSQTLDQLLTQATLAVTWHDTREQSHEELAVNLDDFDCIVVARHDSHSASIQQRNNLVVIDATSFSYDSSRTDATAAEEKQPIHVIYTGLVPVVAQTEQTLSKNLRGISIGVFVTLSIVLIVYLRSLSAAFASIVAITFPIAVVFGFLGWVGQMVDMPAITTASIAVVVAVVNTFHFLNWFRWGIDEGLTCKQAAFASIQRCAGAIAQIVLVVGLSLSVFGVSTFGPTQQLGILSAALMGVTLCGNLILLPALLAGPFGRVIEHEPSGTSSSDHSSGIKLQAHYTMKSNRHAGQSHPSGVK